MSNELQPWRIDNKNPPPPYGTGGPHPEGCVVKFVSPKPEWRNLEDQPNLVEDYMAPKPEERKPLLSDEEVRGAHDPMYWPPTSVSASQVFPRIAMKPEDVRDFYESKITSGELMVVKSTSFKRTVAFAECGHCGFVHDDTRGHAPKAGEFCRCGAKIVKE